MSHTPRVRIFGGYSYWASADGRIFSKVFWRGTVERELSQRFNQDGYPAVRLTINGRYQMFLVHGLVLTAFRGPRPAGKVARHLNGIRTDNRITNLRWGTHKENAQDRHRHGKWRGGRQRLLLPSQIADVIERRAEGARLGALAAEFGLSEASISRIARGKQFVQ